MKEKSITSSCYPRAELRSMDADVTQDTKFTVSDCRLDLLVKGTSKVEITNETAAI